MIKLVGQDKTGLQSPHETAQPRRRPNIVFINLGEFVLNGLSSNQLEH